jgi:hypothetical protein
MPNLPEYVWYGGKGVVVCSLWYEEFLIFKKWALTTGYSKELTIDRVNTDGNYSPDNCRWVSMQIQTRNRTKRKDCSSKYHGVSFDPKRKKYSVSVYISGKRVLNKRVDCEVIAAKMRDQYIIDHKLLGYKMNF